MRLKNKSNSLGISYQHCLMIFMQEEFLRRLSLSAYRDNLILKGGMFIYTLTNFESRTTVDIDLLMKNMSNDLDQMGNAIKEIINVDTGNDFVRFEVVGTKPIAVNRKYPGVRTQIIGYIGNVRVPFDIDIGVDDVIFPKATIRTIQTQLEDFEKPRVLTYSVESTIAEKLHAMLERFELTGRMKDFYDMYYLCHTFNFDGNILKSAIEKTFIHRQVDYSKESFNRLVQLVDDKTMQKKWRLFTKKSGFDGLDFSEVMLEFNTFMHPVWCALLDKEDMNKTWNCGLHEWQ